MRLEQIELIDRQLLLPRDVRDPRDWARPWVDKPGWMNKGCNCSCSSCKCADTTYFSFVFPTRTDDSCIHCSSLAGAIIGLSPTVGGCTWNACTGPYGDYSCSWDCGTTMTAVLDLSGPSTAILRITANSVTVLYSVALSSFNCGSDTTMSLLSVSGAGSGFCTWPSSLVISTATSSVCGGAGYDNTPKVCDCLPATSLYITWNNTGRWSALDGLTFELKYKPVGDAMNPYAYPIWRSDDSTCGTQTYHLQLNCNSCTVCGATLAGGALSLSMLGFVDKTAAPCATGTQTMNFVIGLCQVTGMSFTCSPLSWTRPDTTTYTMTNHVRCCSGFADPPYIPGFTLTT